MTDLILVLLIIALILSVIKELTIMTAKELRDALRTVPDDTIVMAGDNAETPRWNVSGYHSNVRLDANGKSYFPLILTEACDEMYRAWASLAWSARVNREPEAE